MERKTEVLPARKNKLPAELGSLPRNITPDEYTFSIVLLSTQCLLFMLLFFNYDLLNDETDSVV